MIYLQPDLIAEVVEKHLGSEELSHRKIADISDVKEDESGLYSLINVGSYRAAANLTARILTRLGQGYGAVYSEKPAVHTKRSLHIWFIRFAVLIKLGEYELLQKEAEPFHQLRRHDVFYQVCMMCVRFLFLISSYSLIKISKIA